MSYGNKVDALSTSLKPLTPGEVARSIVTERDVGTGVLWLCGISSFFRRRKKKQKSRRRLLPRLCPKPRNAFWCEKKHMFDFSL